MKKLALFLGCLMMLTGCASQQKTLLKLNQQDYVFELGQPIDLNASSYLSVAHLDKKLGDDILLNSIFSVEETEADRFVKEDLVYEKPGTYNAWVTYGDEQLRFEIIVEDTKEPLIEGPSMITIENGQTLNINQYFSVFDYNDVHPLKIENNLDIYTVGTQTIVLSSEDLSGNTARKEVEIVVNAPLEPVSPPVVYKKHIELPVLFIEKPEGITGLDDVMNSYMGLNYKHSLNIEAKVFVYDFIRTLYKEEYDQDKTYQISINQFIKATSSYGKCEDMTGANNDTLIKALEQDSPVMVYLTKNNTTKCVLIKGYDEEKNCFLIIDPTDVTNNEINIDDFNQSFIDQRNAIKIN